MTIDPRHRLAARRAGGVGGGGRPDSLAAAVHLETLADDMRAGLHPEPEPAEQTAVAPVPLPPEPAPPIPAPEVDTRGPRAGDPLEWAPPVPPFEAGPRRLDWRPNHDPRSRRFAARRVASGTPLQPVMLPLGPVLDQGTDGECAGYASIAARNVLTLQAGGGDLYDGGQASKLFDLAQVLDEIPGENYPGTSITGAMAAGMQMGLWGGYLWDFGTRDIAQTLLARRPVVIGIPWAESMYETGPRGVVQVSGEVGAIGHALCLVGLELTGPNGEPGVHFAWQNSWGYGYGDEGIGWIAHRTLATLLAQHGEAAVPTLEAQEAAA